MGLQFQIYDIVPFVALSSMVGLVTILPGNIGIIEYAFGVVGSILSLPFGIGMLLSLLIRLLTYPVFLAYFAVFISFPRLTKVK